ncbi:MAG: bifunctional UDP-N-acetylmuramoyl-L-alanyl-D-glutamate--2,6-diaminopimelate ligase MurE/UDP-N-acetylmuramoyl-tripeptide--D-alanyl-D-alanine ligase MurF [Rhodoferax sp.]|nr:bifunctional UDP-N-acetylmuramoyl-L-alanyl-D-glutamate--2,6-diaminopimelate ligase MurE/UDP-N-acetylmuramoyl-tripeptide--D-alanyl-D-alanine ligase MurF [Rhodoferax sp.]
MQLLHSPEQAAQWLRAKGCTGLGCDSRKLQPGDGLLAWPGARSDARSHVMAALPAGAPACLVEAEGVERFGLSDARVASYPGLQAHSGLVADAFFEHPSQQLKLLAVTGTNGKTSSAWWIAQALSNLKRPGPVRCAVIGTLGIGYGPALVATGLTTPDAPTLQTALARLVAEGAQACAIEASSIGLQEHRLDGTCIHTALLTNLTQDHLDYHGNMAAYGAAKAALFDWPGLRAAVINVDDPFGAALAQRLAARQQVDAPALWTLSVRTGADNHARLQAQAIEHASGGVGFDVVEGVQRVRLATQLVGDYNVANLLGVIAALRTLEVPLVDAVQACAALTPVPGRMECVSLPGQPLVAVDYAHTPDALAKALDALRPLAQQRGGKLWCVFGCGGDRDNSKRPLMGALAGRAADCVLVTSDNPRSEVMEAIISQILLGLEGVPGVRVEPDRARAIAQAIDAAAPEDVLLVAGKGHEDYQEIKGQRLPFSDLVQVRQALALRVGVAGETTAAPSQLSASVSMMMTAAQVSGWLASATSVGLAEGATFGFDRVQTDSRSVAPGDLFVALRGEHFDASDFLADVRAKGALAAICQGDQAAAKLAQAGLPGWRVVDTRRALAQLAAGYRAQFALPLIGVTGSNGKTTVTQMIASILRADQGAAALATQGNLNNDIGVPQTVLRLRPAHQIAVVEMGMNHPGEIASLAAVAQPTVALVNNAQREHLEFMQTVQAVAEENGSVISALPPDGVAVFPADDAFSGRWATLAGNRRTLRFAVDASVAAEVFVLQATWNQAAWQVRAATPAGELVYTLHIAGAHNVKNSLAAMACALAAGVSLAAIAQGLCAFEPVKGRSRALQVSYQGRSITLVDDSYNANPDSVRAAINVLATLPGPRLLVLGDMGEVGDQGPQFHAEALRDALTKNIEKVLVTGAATAQAAMQFKAVKVLPEIDALQAAVLAELPVVASVLVKGSRFMQMERVVQAVLAATSPLEGDKTC